MFSVIVDALMLKMSVLKARMPTIREKTGAAMAAPEFIIIYNKLLLTAGNHDG